MTLDEAINHAEEVIEEQEKLAKRYDDASGYTRSHIESIRTSDAKQCIKCADEHQQLAEWLKELKQLREHTRWIPVSERLPEDNTRVLVTVKVENREPKVRSGYYYMDGHFYIDNGDCWKSRDKELLAWMPLPKPY